MARKVCLALMKVAGYHGDKRTWTRLLIENRVSMPAAQQAFAEGARAKMAGMRCACAECRDVAAITDTAQS